MIKAVGDSLRLWRQLKCLSRVYMHNVKRLRVQQLMHLDAHSLSQRREKARICMTDCIFCVTTSTTYRNREQLVVQNAHARADSYAAGVNLTAIKVLTITSAINCNKITCPKSHRTIIQKANTHIISQLILINDHCRKYSFNIFLVVNCRSNSNLISKQTQ